jgi:hypothetical protein
MRISLRSPGAAAAGCSSGGGDPLSGMSAKQIITKAEANLKSASAITVAGAGLEAPGRTVTFNLGFKGRDCTGTVGYGSDGTIDLILIGSRIWLKPNTTFRDTQGGSDGAVIAQLLAGRWIDAPTSNSNAAAFAELCNEQAMTSELPPVPADVARGSLTTISGQKVLSLTDKARDQQAKDRGLPAHHHLQRSRERIGPAEQPDRQRRAVRFLTIQ